MKSDLVDIRTRVRAYGARQVTLARLAAPADWEDELRTALRDQRSVPSVFARGSDLRLFAESFVVFFAATMIFLL